LIPLEYLITACLPANMKFVSLDWRIILNWTLSNCIVSGLAYESSHSGYVKILGKFAHGYELPGPIIDVEFF
jgi:hypothetical protein